MIVEGERIDPASMDFLEMEQIYRQKSSASRNFKIGKYEEAFPETASTREIGIQRCPGSSRVSFPYTD